MELYIKGFLIALKGVPATVSVSLVAVIIGAVCGLFIALARLAKNKIASTIAKIYIDVVRGTPMVVQAFIFAYGLPQLIQSGGGDFKWPELWIPALIVCGLNSAAYMAEVIRSGIQAVDKGQAEAAKSLGMPYKMSMKLIIIPQAIRIITPAIGNEFITLIKETAVLSFVGVIEIMRRGTLWNSTSFETFPAYIGVALAYLVLTVPLSKTVLKFEKKMNKEQ